jgi:hypothetical protein
MTDQRRWRPVLFDCPRTGQTVQGLVAEEAFNEGDSRLEMVHCPACSENHFIDPSRGRSSGIDWR